MYMHMNILILSIVCINTIYTCAYIFYIYIYYINLSNLPIDERYCLIHLVFDTLLLFRFTMIIFGF